MLLFHSFSRERQRMAGGRGDMSRRRFGLGFFFFFLSESTLVAIRFGSI